MPFFDGENPFDVDNELDFLQPPDRTRPLWTENMFFQGWDDSAGVGFWWHAGRWPYDLELWHSHMLVYLPDGQVVTDRSFGRPRDNLGPVTGAMRVQCEEPGRRWSLRYDGAGERLPGSELNRRLAGAGRIATVQMEIEHEALMPTWDLYKMIRPKAQVWSDTHHQQALTMRGRITVDGQTWDVDGMSYRDHSTGPRDWAGFGGNAMLTVMFPSGRVIFGAITWDSDGTENLNVGYLYEGNRFETLERLTLPPLHDLDSNPWKLDATFGRDGADDIAISGVALHTAAVSFVEPNEILCGVDLSDPSDPLLLVETPVRFTWADGEIGIGNLERNYRISAVSGGTA